MHRKVYFRWEFLVGAADSLMYACAGHCIGKRKSVSHAWGPWLNDVMCVGVLSRRGIVRTTDNVFCASFLRIRALLWKFFKLADCSLHSTVMHHTTNGHGYAVGYTTHKWRS